MEKHPSDLQINSRYQQLLFKRSLKQELSESTDFYANSAKKHPREAVYQYLYARSLVGSDTLKAIEILSRLLQTDPAFPWPHLGLAAIRSAGRFSDEKAFGDNLRAFLHSCSDTLDPEPWELAQRLAGKTDLTEQVHLLRANLQAQRDDYGLPLWSNLWDLEFKTVPVNEHEQLRKLIRQDAAQLAEGASNVQRLWLARRGYQLAGDTQDERSINERLKLQFPASRQVCELRRAEWTVAHPYPDANATEEVKGRCFKELSIEASRQTRDCPTALIWREKLMALSKIPGTPAVQLSDAGRGYLEAYHLDGTLIYWPPPELSVADVYLQYGANLTDVPELVHQGLVNFSKLRFYTDQATEGDGGADGELSVRIEAARLLTEDGRQRGDPEIARPLVIGLETAATHNQYLNYYLARLRANFADSDNKKLDALLLYRNAASQVPPGDSEGSQQIAIAEDRLLKILGGSESTRALWKTLSMKVSPDDSVEWLPVSKTMAAWKLTDIHGKVWDSERLKGKRVFINAWATWCVPCQQELSVVEELYQKTKDRSDIQLLTFNVDEEVGRVEPFVQQKHYSFPVLFAKGYVDTAIGNSGIPQSWIVGADGKWLLQHSGFNSDPQWVEKTLQKVEGATAN